MINFEVPKTFEAYQHRVGRTGRVGDGRGDYFFGPSDEEAYHVLLKGYADAAAVAKAAEAKEEDDDEEEDEREEEDVDDFLKPLVAFRKKLRKRYDTERKILYARLVKARLKTRVCVNFAWNS